MGDPRPMTSQIAHDRDGAAKTHRKRNESPGESGPASSDYTSSDVKV